MFVRTSYAQRYCSQTCRVSEQADYSQKKYVERVGRPLKPRGARPALEKRAKVKALREEGKSLAEIAAVTGVTRQAVSIMLKKLRQSSITDTTA